MTSFESEWGLVATITLVGAPRGKGRPRASVGRHNGRVHMHTDAKTRSYETQLREAAQAAMGDAPPVAVAVRVLFEMDMPVPSSWSKRKRADALAGVIRPCVKPDADNALKLTDALNYLVWEDDKQIVDARVVKRYSERPGVVISVWRIVSDEERSASVAGSDALARVMYDRLLRRRGTKARAKQAAAQLDLLTR